MEKILSKTITLALKAHEWQVDKSSMLILVYGGSIHNLGEITGEIFTDDVLGGINDTFVYNVEFISPFLCTSLHLIAKYAQSSTYRFLK